MKASPVVVLLALMLLAVSSTASAGPTVHEFQESSGAVRQYQTIYLLGTLAGYGGANAALIDREVDPLFCQPARLSITASQIVRIVEDFLQAHPELSEDGDLSVLTLFALQEAFPCPGGRMAFTGPSSPER